MGRAPIQLLVKSDTELVDNPTLALKMCVLLKRRKCRDPMANREGSMKRRSFSGMERFTSRQWIEGGYPCRGKFSFVEGIDGVVRWAVRALAILMTFVVIMGVVEVVWGLYDRLRQPPIMKLEIMELEATFGTFMAVLVAIAILANITLRLREKRRPRRGGDGHSAHCHGANSYHSRPEPVFGAASVGSCGAGSGDVYRILAGARR